MIILLVICWIFFSNYGFVQFVDQPTRFCLQGRGNILDIVLSDDQFMVKINEVGVPFSTSDHCTVEFGMTTVCDVDPLHSSDPRHTSSPDPSEPTVPVYDWRNADFESINLFLQSFDWNLLFGYYFDSETLWNNFKSILWSAIALHVPTIQVSHHVKYNTKRYPRRILQLLSRKSAIWRMLGTLRRSSGFTDSVSYNSFYDKYRTVANECKQRS